MPPRYKLKKPALAALAVIFLAALWLGGLYNFTRDMFRDAAAAISANDFSANDASNSPARLDAIVVLTGGSNRLQTGFDLLEQGRGEKLFISGVYQGVEVRELMDQWKKGAHADLDCCVVLGFDADDTRGNAEETAQWMEAENYRSLYLVTAHYHMKRALLEFGRLGTDWEIRPWPVIPAGMDMHNWWRDTRYRSLIIREYNKYLAALALPVRPRKKTIQKTESDK